MPDHTDYFNRLLNGITTRVEPEQVARFVASMLGADLPKQPDENVPGFDYVQRVASAGSRAVIEQASDTNVMWSEMKQGRFGFGSYVKTWARTVDRWYGVMLEATKAPGYTERPVWLLFEYSKSSPEPALGRSVTIDCVLADEQLDKTGFSAIGANGTLTAQVYHGLTRVEGPREVHVQLSPDQIGKEIVSQPNGNYVSFIFSMAKGPVAPLVIVVLRVKD